MRNTHSRVTPPHSMDGYTRDKFDIWGTQPDGCTTRQDVLARDGKNVQDKPDHCQPASGSWYSAYDDTTTAVAKATIDHMVPLAEAWRSGAYIWSTDRRKAFGNDLKAPGRSSRRSLRTRRSPTAGRPTGSQPTTLSGAPTPRTTPASSRSGR
ncbi:hypothetical protein ABT187_41145 [Streptomyces sp. NPDC001817]|uniref:hypothetical protein n=1 Tax=Streptomyces sp. NPDC001817 TaxID=3154398 RepID=UPI003324D277